MSDDYLATGFRDVDGAGVGDVYIKCLTLLDSLPFYSQVKQQSYGLMDLGGAACVLDEGCGLGFDAFRMAVAIGPGGHVVGFDASTALMAQAHKDPRAWKLPVSFCAGDLKALPFCASAFDGCRIDRVLQHVPRPETVIAELVRALQPRGILLAYDNDWRTFKVTSDDAALTRRIETHWCHAFANREIGRELPQPLQEAGLTRIESHQHVSVIEDFETADAVYNLRQTADRLAASGEITENEAHAWIAGLEERGRQGCFAAELTAYTVAGRKDG